MRKRLTRWIAATALALLGGVAAAAGGNGDARERKILRYAFAAAETAFDPVQVTDLYSNTLLEGIFEAPLEYTFLAAPVGTRPNTAAAMPEVSADFTTFTFRLRPGIYFADDPAFKGRKRELVAEDYVYSIKRFYDPRWKSGKLYLFENEKILGLSELRKKAIDGKQPFDYDTPAEGLRALDRYTFQIRLAEPSPRFLQNYVLGSLAGALAREVVEAYGEGIGEHPVGTGPFMLKQWKRSSRIVLVRNPNFRDRRYDESPPAGSEPLAQIARRFKGRRLPMIDEVHISIIEESQPRWLAFLDGEQDLIEAVPPDFAPVAFPNNRLAPNLARRGITMARYARPDATITYFQMDDPVVGGYEPHKVALRRAISLAVDVEREIRLARRGQAVAAQGPIPPGLFGHDPRFKTALSDFSRARAKALLDLYGYVDRNGDGWREQPDGSPLVLRYATTPDQLSRQFAELWQENMNAVGLKIAFDYAQWPEQLKASRAGKLMMFGFGWAGATPDGDTFLSLGYGANKGGSNHSRFDLSAYNALYEKQRLLPDGPERLAVMQEATRLLVAYMPLKIQTHRIATDLAHPWVVGYHRHTFNGLFWKYVDIDVAEQRRRGGGAPF
ncbi:MAG: bicyclomycin resistance protein [Rubrivivax sp.]|nr:bicyclomycin resistance protein [Rubrivivax sp.]